MTSTTPPRSSVLSFFVLPLAAALLVACGGDDESGSGGAAATSASATTGDTTSTTTGATTGTGAGGAGGGNPNGFTPMNGCDPETAEDLQDLTVEIQFPVNGFKYSPNCVIIHATHNINFQGLDGSNFVSHPLVPGVVEGGVATEDTDSPIVRTETGDTQTVYFDAPGQFGYYCDYHYAQGMMGVIYVKPAPN